jgi:DnaJ-class molecular chaperone
MKDEIEVAVRIPCGRCDGTGTAKKNPWGLRAECGNCGGKGKVTAWMKRSALFYGGKRTEP